MVSLKPPRHYFNLFLSLPFLYVYAYLFVANNLKVNKINARCKLSELVPSYALRAPLTEVHVYQRFDFTEQFLQRDEISKRHTKKARNF